MQHCQNMGCNIVRTLLVRSVQHASRCPVHICCYIPFFWENKQSCQEFPQKSSRLQIKVALLSPTDRLSKTLSRDCWHWNNGHRLLSDSPLRSARSVRCPPRPAPNYLVHAKQMPGPYLIVVPLSTLEQWMRGPWRCPQLLLVLHSPPLQ